MLELITLAVQLIFIAATPVIWWKAIRVIREELNRKRPA